MFPNKPFFCSRYVIVFLLVVLTSTWGCSLPELIKGRNIVLPCPDYNILADAAFLTKFRAGPGRDLTDVDHSAQIENARISCLSNIDSDTLAGTMDVDVEVMFSVERGPVNTTKTATLPYFVSVTDLNRNILYHETFTILVRFKGNRTRISVITAPIILEIPIKKKESGRDFLIYMGMQLTEEELRFTRERVIE